jgi:16S rRNA (uracil1498-N3)-methyltransferase
LAGPLTSKQFFLERIDPATARAWLEGAEHHHLARVARIRPGEEIWVFDRSGNRYRAEVEAVGKDRSRLRLLGPAAPQDPGVPLTLGQAIIKPANMDLVVRKAAELGVAVFVPLLTARSLQGLAGNGGNKPERWRKIALEAAKQSRRPVATSIGPFTPLGDLITREAEGRKLYLSESGGRPLREVLSGPGGPSAGPPSAVLLTGPEGGWTEAEETCLKEGGFEAVSLGRTVLRAETATIVAVGMIAHFWGG